MAISFYTVAAICGNFHWESTVNPGIYESLNVVPLTDNNVYGGYGLGQWTNAPQYGLTRRTQLVNWLRSNGYADDSGDGQCAYILAENHWVQNVGNYATLNDFLNNTETNINNLTLLWMRNWEGIYNSSISQRRTFANSVYQELIDHYNDPMITDWYAGNRYLSTADQISNSVMVARALMGGSPTPPGPTPTPGPTAEEIILLKKKRRCERL